MPRISKTHKDHKLESPASHFDKPSEVAKDGQQRRPWLLMTKAAREAITSLPMGYGPRKK